MNPEYIRELIRDKNHYWYSIPTYRKEEWESLEEHIPDWAFPVKGYCSCGKCNNVKVE